MKCLSSVQPARAGLHAPLLRVTGGVLKRRRASDEQNLLQGLSVVHAYQNRRFGWCYSVRLR